MELKIRQAKVGDAKGIAGVHVRTWQFSYKGQIPDFYLDSLTIEKRAKSWEKNLKSLGKKVKAIVAEADGNIVGWCTYGASRDEDATKESGELHGIYVLPKYMGKGVGSALMDKALADLRLDGHKGATLWVLDSNTKTRKWYESRKWEVEGKTKVDQRDGFELNEVRYVIKL